MARPSSFFETGTHHILCKIAGLDPKEFPYPRDFQDCWDHHHVRLACSDRPTNAAVPNAWPDIVQGLTTTIVNSKQLSEILSRWNEGDPRGWNIDALEAFLNKKADREDVALISTSATSTSTSTRSTPSDRRFQDDSDDVVMSDSNNDHGDDGKTDTPSATSAGSSFVRWDHNDGTAEDQFLTREERDRFFKVILPGMQQLALRLPELVKRPIPFLKQQEDAAVTLSQEQIACLLANAFFCTFPCRNAPNQHFSNPGPPRKRPLADQSKDSGTGKREWGGGRGAGRTLDSAPKDPHGATTMPRIKKQLSSNTDPFKNTEGQLSLFAYFKKAEPKASIKSESSKSSLPAVASRHFDNGQDKGREVGVQRDDLSEHAKVESGRESHRTGNESATRRPPPSGGRDQKRSPFPRYPSINFSSLFYSDDVRNSCTSTNAAKLRCIIHYFDRILQQMPIGVVTFHRQVLNETITLDAGEMLNQAPYRYPNVRIELDAPLEDDAPLGALQLDFANKVIGGGVLGRGAVQEEIRFAICPELIVSRLFTQTFQSNEAMLMKGAERFSNYNGYAQTFEWHSDHIDTTPRDKLGRRNTEICAIDALPFKSAPERLDQFCESAVLRELNKAIAGFRRSPITSSDWGLCRGEVPSPRGDLIATGNWGCGAFGGHLQLKFLIQLLAASVCAAYSRVDDGDVLGRDLVYFTYGLDGFADEIQTFMTSLHASPQLFEPWKLLDCIVNYPIKSGRGDIVALRSNKSLLDYVGASFGFPNASHSNSHGSLSVTDTQSSPTFDSFSWSDNDEYNTPEREPLSD
ncbi:hypothetical protein BGZ96_012245 [Linnemannia gamsii]|uniref:poly(ADP-ribose) glycohydrolase n=1 Tax=Linnemannia gamsii TaxID=64522 RepID=A0ABQ7KCF0_9FUNG|nr:hypothetical protein BGZ96_012245 [Linnemannia gamsii]